MQKAITKEELKSYPIRHFEGEISVFETWSEKDDVAFLEFVGSNKIFGIDTETKPAFKKGVVHQVSLLQICNGSEVWVIRLHKCGLPDIVANMLNNENLVKVGIAVYDDVRELEYWSEELDAQNVIDLNIFAVEKGFASIGAKRLTALLLDFTISKKQQVSNWEHPRLSPAQITYAATDAWICNLIYDKLLEH